MIGYHVTAPWNRGSIATYGLLTAPPHVYPSGKVESAVWDHGMVWFFIDLDVARAAAAMWTGRCEHDLWAIDLDGLDVIADPHPGWGTLRPGWDDAARAVTSSVSPERLRLVA